MCKKMINLVFLALVLSLASVASADLVAHWKFDEGSGDIAFDSSGNGYDATLINNPVWVPGKLGPFALDTQAGGYGAIQGLSYEGTGFPEVSVCAWIRTSNGGNQFIASFDRNEYWRLSIATSDGVDTGEVGWHLQTDAGGILDYASETQVDDGEWHHVCGVFDNGLATIYIDAEPEPSVESGSTYGSGNLRYGFIGRNSEATEFNGSNSGNPVDGDIDDLRIYDHALSRGEILAAMAGMFEWPFTLDPEPADGALVEATWANLAWEPGALAVSHDVYFGTSFDDVNEGLEETFAGNVASNEQIVGFAGFPAPEGLIPGTTYYWRVDEVNEANPESPWKGDVWSFTVPPRIAYNPDPADGMQFILTDATLSWAPGFEAKLHNVFFGDNFDDVNSAIDAVASVQSTFTPGTLELGKTYYWRVDEFDGSATNKGDVWSFTTMPEVEVTNPNLKLWWNLDEGMGGNVVDRSGHGNHGVINGEAAWVGGYLGTALLFGEDVYVESEYEGITGTAPRTCSAWVRTANTGNHNIMSWGQNQTGQKWRMRVNGANGVLRVEVNGGYHYGVTPIADGLWHHVAVTFEDDGTPDVVDTLLYVDGQRDATDVSQATEINTGNGPVRIGESPWHNAPFLDIIDDARIYDKVLTAEEIRLAMRIDPQLAWDPVPANETLAPMNFADQPSWSAGDGVSQYDVYLGSDQAAVEAADASDTTGIYRGRQIATSYALPEGVDPNTGPFYWRVDSVTSDGTIVTGRLWSFTVADYARIDDFETYNDVPAGEPGSNLVYVAWVDGFDNPNANGSTMGYVTGVSMERDTVLGGNQAVPLQYNNTTAGVSEVVRTFAPAQDWMANDMQTLSLSFVGSGTNVPGQLYVKVNGVQVNYRGDRSNLTLAGWQTWNIPLDTINANVSNVTSMSIGIQGAGATGTLILDNIRLYPYPAETITPVQPDPAGLALHYAFEGNTNDSAGANQGTAFGSPTYVMGKVGQAIMLDGLDDYVAIDNFSYADRGLTEVSVCAWIRTNVEDNQIIVSFDRNEYWRLEINGDGAGPGEAAWDVMTDTGQVDYESSGGSTTRVDDDQWHHVAGVFDNGKVTLYIDGNPQTPAFGGPTFGSGTPRFGYVGLGSESTEFNLEPRTPASFFNGSVDDVRIYERALSDGEVAGLAGRTTAFDKPF